MTDDARTIPVAHLRAMIALLSPSELTPTAQRQLTLLCEDAQSQMEPAPDTTWAKTESVKMGWSQMTRPDDATPSNIPVTVTMSMSTTNTPASLNHIRRLRQQIADNRECMTGACRHCQDNQ